MFHRAVVGDVGEEQNEAGVNGLVFEERGDTDLIPAVEELELDFGVSSVGDVLVELRFTSEEGLEMFADEFGFTS